MEGILGRQDGNLEGIAGVTTTGSRNGGYKLY